MAGSIVMAGAVCAVSFLGSLVDVTRVQPFCFPLAVESLLSSPCKTLKTTKMMMIGTRTNRSPRTVRIRLSRLTRRSRSILASSRF